MTNRRVYNIDETVFCTEHSLLTIICDNNIKPQVVEYNRSTVISIASLQLTILFGIKFHNIMCSMENGGIQKL